MQTPLISLFIFGAKYLFILSPLAAFIYFFKAPREVKKKLLILGLPSLLTSYIAAKIFSHFYYNPRPFVVEGFKPLIAHVADNGFPSDHALLAAAIAGIMTIFNKRLGSFLWLVAILVAVSRVYVGVHHWLDVLGSFAIALLVTYLYNWLITKKLWIKTDN